jgi:hypothetical protein
VPGAHGRIPSGHPGARADGRHAPALELHRGLKHRRCPAWLHADNVVSLVAGVRPEQTRAISSEENAGLGTI